MSIKEKIIKPSLVEALEKNMNKVEKIEDSINKMMSKRMILAFIDSEYSIDTNETYCSCALLAYWDKREMKVIGEIKNEGNLDFSLIHKKVKEYGVDECHIIAHFNIVDITRIEFGIDVEIDVLELQKSACINFEYDGIKYKMRDTMLYSLQSLEKIIKDFSIDDNSKEFLRNIAIKNNIMLKDGEDARKYMDQLWLKDKDGVMEYCLMDCKATYEFMRKLDEISRSITREECGLEFSIVPFLTLGAFNERYQYLKARKRGDKTFMDLNEKEDINAMINHLSMMESSYKGGGIIYNDFVGMIDLTNLHAYQFDVTSLYPISAMLIPNISLRLKDWRSMEEEVDITMHDVKEKINYLKERGALEAFIHVCGEMPNNEWHPLLSKISIGNMIMEDEEDNSTLISTKLFDAYVSLKELESIIKWLESKSYDLKSIKIKVMEGKYTKVQGKNWLKDNFISLMNSKNKYDSEGKSALKEMFKLLMNSAYGKLAQKIEGESWDGRNKELLISFINDPILVSLLTSYSRALMIDLMRVVEEMSGGGCKVIHMAQDSMIIISDHDIKEALLNHEEYKKVENSIKNMGVDNYTYLKCEVDSKRDGYTTLIVLRDKLYAWMSDKGKDDGIKIKEAHHAIHLPKDKDKIREWWITLKEHLEHGEIIAMPIERENWLKKDDYLRLRERLLGISKDEPIRLSELLLKTKRVAPMPIYKVKEDDTTTTTIVILNEHELPIHGDELSLYMPYKEISLPIISRSKKLKYDEDHPCNPFIKVRSFNELLSCVYKGIYNTREEYMHARNIMNRISNDVREVLRGKRQDYINSKRVNECRLLGWVYMSKVLEDLGSCIKSKRVIRQGNKTKRATIEESKKVDERERKIIEIINSMCVKGETIHIDTSKMVEVLKEKGINTSISTKSLGKILRKHGFVRKKLHGKRLWLRPNIKKENH